MRWDILRGGARAMATVLMVLGVEGTIAGSLFLAAGRLDLPWFWAVVALHAGFLGATVSRMDPELRRERVRPRPGGRDRGLRRMAAPLLIVHLVVAGLDAGRFGWSGPIPVAVRAVALAGYAAGLAVTSWAMVTNRFFSPVVRIQRERGHRVVADGPYRVVRHPGYLGGLVAAFCGGVALGSWWSLVPLVPAAALILRRTALEDRLLREGLEGYAGYADRVPYRLVPGVW